MIDVAAWFLAYAMIATSAYLRTRNLIVAAAAPLLAQLVISGIGVLVA